MRTPRSVNGFKSALAKLEADLKKIEYDLSKAEDGQDTTDLVNLKVDKEVEMAEMTEKFEEFSAKAEEPAEELPTVETAKASEVEDKAWPEVLLVSTVSTTYLTNPFTGQQINKDAWVKVPTDKWTIYQIENGVLKFKE